MLQGTEIYHRIFLYHKIKGSEGQSISSDGYITTCHVTMFKHTSLCSENLNKNFEIHIQATNIAHTVAKNKIIYRHEI